LVLLVKYCRLSLNAGGLYGKDLSGAVPKLSDRKIIAVRGHHGRAKVALKAISELSGSSTGDE
jgi:hypothetical protein